MLTLFYNNLQTFTIFSLRFLTSRAINIFLVMTYETKMLISIYHLSIVRHLLELFSKCI